MECPRRPPPELPCIPPGAPGTSVRWRRRLPEDAGLFPGRGHSAPPLPGPGLFPHGGFGCLMETGFKGKSARTLPQKIITGLCGGFSPPHTIPKVSVGGQKESGRAAGHRGDMGCPWPARTAAQPGTMVLSSRRSGSGTRWLLLRGWGSPPARPLAHAGPRPGGAMAQPHGAPWGSARGTA